MWTPTNRGLLNAKRKTLKSKTPAHPDSVVLLNGVWAHETYGVPSTGAKGHQGQIEVAATSLPTCGKAPTILERIVAKDPAEAYLRGLTVHMEASHSLYAAADHIFVYGNHGPGPFYEVVPQTTVADNLSPKTAAGDAKALSMAPDVAPDTNYKCTRVY